MNLSFKGLQKISSTWLKQLEKADELKKIGNKKNYKHKVDKLKERLTEEFKFWVGKGSSAKLNDIQRDVKLIASLQNKTIFTPAEEVKIDQLVKKYPID
jgi:hypothetical protein